MKKTPAAFINVTKPSHMLPPALSVASTEEIII